MKNGEQEFPIRRTLRPDGWVGTEASEGLSKREWFAAMALPGVIACPYMYDSDRGIAARL